jgi:S-DNA-T family DNA segregation ATPase FtsK/SpoIIIE
LRNGLLKFLLMATNAQKSSVGNEIVGILLLASGVLLFLCLLTYNANDASVMTVSRQETQNLIGAIGANIAAVLFQAVGLTALIVPLLLFWAAWQTFWAESLRVSAARLSGFVLLVACLAALLQLFGGGVFFDDSVSAGGLIGILTSSFFAAGLGKAGATILLTAIGAAAFLPVTGFSYAPFLVWLKIRYDAALARLRAWREREKEQARLRLENRRRMQAELRFARENKIALAPVAAASGNDKNGIFRAAWLSCRNFLEQIKQPPAFAEEESKQFAAAETQSINVKPRRAAPRAPKQENEFPPEIADETVSAANDEDDKIFKDETVFDGDNPISIQPLKSGDAEEISSANEENAAAIENPQSASYNLSTAAPRVFVPYANYELPTTEFLNAAPARIQHADEELLNIAKTLEAKCLEFRAAGKVVNICPGPVVTTYEYKLNNGVQFKTISALVDDLCLGLQAESVRIDRIPGKAFVGIEVPNPRRETIFLREVLEARAFRESSSLLTIALGKTVDGLNYVADLAKMPHLLIAGATGAGKSVGVNSLIVSILYKARPDEVKFILVDPKQVELNLYEDIPHLAAPIITDPKRAAIALKWAVAEMERRYKILSGWFVRNIEGYNAEVHRRNFIEEFDEAGESWKPLPYIVIIVDEFADLMLTARGEVEESIMRLVAKARAVGIHLILATQRPSVDVVTGVIKANFPCRIAFRVSSGIDSKTIINTTGAEHLLGRGDMLFLPPGASKLVRVHGAFVDESEIQKIVSHIKAQGAPEYDASITQTEEEASGGDISEDEQDELFEQALRICVEMKRASTSVLQRRLSIGYGRAAKIIDAMERAGYVGAADGASKPRPVLGKAYEKVAE